MLWGLVRRRTVEVADSTDHAERIFTLMRKYRDAPMSFADAGFVALAEARGLGRIFTLDQDFGVYRHRDRRPFEVVPGAVERGHRLDSRRDAATTLTMLMPCPSTGITR